MATEMDDVEDNRRLDRRLVVLETRFDTILPTLATKADLAELKGELLAKMSDMKAEIRSEFRVELARLTRWMVTIAVAMFVGFGGMFMSILSRLPG